MIPALITPKLAPSLLPRPKKRNNCSFVIKNFKLKINNLINFTRPLIGLSPMDGLTDEPFRLLQAQIAHPDITFTEFVSAEGLAHNAVKLFDHLLYSPLERPIIGQLFGKDPDSFYTAALILCYLGFDGVDINMGCPARTVTQHGSGAALIEKPALAAEIIKAVQSAISDYSSHSRQLSDLKLKEKTYEFISHNNTYSQNKNISPPTFSIKTRLGTNHSVVDTWITHLCQFKPDFITLHGRTLAQGYAGLADWDEIRKASTIVHQAGLKIFGNGDIKSYQQGIDYSQKYGTDGVLIGRACLGNPWIFSPAPVDVTPRLRFDTMVLQAQIARKLFPARQFDYLRQQFLFYAAGLPTAKKLRSSLVRVSTLDQLCALEADFINGKIETL